MDEAALRSALARLADLLGGRRRLLAAGFAAVAVVGALQLVAPREAATVRVWAAARDLTGGQPLTAGDLRPEALPLAAVPAGALRAGSRVIGRLLAAPVRRGEPLTDVRLLEPSLLAALPAADLVAVPVRLTDASAAAAIVHVGDSVDVIAVGDPATGTRAAPVTVARAVQVLAVPARAAAVGDGGGIVVVAATSSQAAALAAASVGSRLSLVLRRT